MSASSMSANTVNFDIAATDADCHSDSVVYSEPLTSDSCVNCCDTNDTVVTSNFLVQHDEMSAAPLNDEAYKTFIQIKNTKLQYFDLPTIKSLQITPITCKDRLHI